MRKSGGWGEWKEGAEEKKKECVVLNKVRSEVQRDCRDFLPHLCLLVPHCCDSHFFPSFFLFFKFSNTPLSKNHSSSGTEPSVRTQHSVFSRCASKKRDLELS